MKRPADIYLGNTGNTKTKDLPLIPISQQRCSRVEELFVQKIVDVAIWGEKTVDAFRIKERFVMRRLFLFLSILALIFGCTSAPPVTNPHIKESNLPSQSLLKGIQPIKQEYNGCVPACVEMVFRFYGKEMDKNAIAIPLNDVID
jgi:hypothetical protein